MRPIILEGPDGSGKSTLARALSYDLGLKIHHPGGPPKNVIEFQARLNVYDALGSTVIYDRSPHISEIIYSQIYQRKTILPATVLISRFQDLNPVVVFCRLRSVRKMWLSVDQTAKGHKPIEHMAKVMAQYAELVKAYDDFFANPVGLNSSVIRYDWFDDSYPLLKQKVERACAV